MKVNLKVKSHIPAIIEEKPLNLQWAVIKDQYIICPIYGGNGRVLIQEDPYKSQFDCSKCGGKKHLGVICEWCKGTKYHKGNELYGACRDCEIKTELGMRSLGFTPCNLCHGAGGTIVIPEENQINTTTGNVLAISDREILEVTVNDKVMFTKYSGSPFKFLGLDLRIVIERDLLARVKQLKRTAEGINEGSFTELDNLGVPRI